MFFTQSFRRYANGVVKIFEVFTIQQRTIRAFSQAQRNIVHRQGKALINPIPL